MLEKPDLKTRREERKKKQKQTTENQRKGKNYSKQMVWTKKIKRQKRSIFNK